MYYRGIFKCREADCGYQTRSLLLNNRCMVAGCKGRVRSMVSESQANDTLRYLQGLFHVEKYLNELKMTRADAGDKIPHEQMLDEVRSYVDKVLDRSKYNKVDLSEIFSFMVKV